MTLRVFRWAGVCGLLCAVLIEVVQLTPQAQEPQPQAIEFSRDIRPILDRNCTSCHQPASKQSDLDLTTFDRFQAGGRRGPAFVPGSPEQSLVIQFITAAMKPSMPMGQPPLAATDVSRIRDWISSGAKGDAPSEIVSSEPAVYHQAPVITALRFSPDGQTLAVSGNREVLLHRADGSGIVKRLPGKSDRILSIAFSADGNLMIAGGGTPARFGEIQFWDPNEGKLLRAAETTSDTVFGASLSPDASKVAVGCADNTVRAFETATGKELYKISAHENWVLGTTFGMDSKRLVSVGRDRAAKLIDADAGQFLENVNQMHGELAAVARHPRADDIVIGGEDRIPYIYKMDRPRNMKVGENATLVRQLAAQDGAIFALDWSPDGKRVAVGGAGPTVNIYDAESGLPLASCKGHTAGIYAVAFSPDSTRVATGGFDGQVRLYSAAACTLEKSFVPVPLVNQPGRRCAMKWRVLLLSVSAVIVSASSLSAQPVITELQPRGVQKGKPFTLTLTGRNLGEGAKIRSTMPASFTLLTPDQPAMQDRPMAPEGRYATFLVEPAADLAVGVYAIRVVTTDGISNVQLFTVGAFPEFSEDESRPGALPNTNDSTETAQLLPPGPFTLNGTLRGPERDIFRLRAKGGDKRVIEVEARRSGSALDPLLEILDASGRVIARSEDAPLLGLDARVEVTFPRDGDYDVVVRDARFSTQTANFYRLKIGSYSYPRDVFPLGGRRGAAGRDFARSRKNQR